MPYIPPSPLEFSNETFIYGDQFPEQAIDFLAWFHLNYRNGPLHVRASAGTTLGDWLSQIRSDLRGEFSPLGKKPRSISLSFSSLGDYAVVRPNDNYDAVAMDAWDAANDPVNIESSGRGYLVWTDTLDAVLGYSLEEDGFIYADYHTLLPFIRAARAAAFVGVEVYWILPPPPVVDTNRLLEIAMIEEICAHFEWHVVYANESVADVDGTWIETLPCLVDEDVDQGCSAGEIQIRDGEDFYFGGVAIGYDGIVIYSSGARRWASAAVTGMPDSAAVEGCEVWACP